MMVTYRKMYDVTCVGKLDNFNGFVFEDDNNKLLLIYGNEMEDPASKGDKGVIYYKSHSRGGSHVYKSK